MTYMRQLMRAQVPDLKVHQYSEVGRGSGKQALIDAISVQHPRVHLPYPVLLILWIIYVRTDLLVMISNKVRHAWVGIRHDTRIATSGDGLIVLLRLPRVWLLMIRLLHHLRLLLVWLLLVRMLHSRGSLLRDHLVVICRIVVRRILSMLRSVAAVRSWNLRLLLRMLLYLLSGFLSIVSGPLVDSGDSTVFVLRSTVSSLVLRFMHVLLTRAIRIVGTLLATTIV